MQKYKRWETKDFPPALRADVERYSEWLHAQALRYSSHGQEQELFEYAQLANQTYTVGQKQVHPFAPFRMHLSALRTITRGQYAALTALVVCVALLWYFFGITLLSALCACCVLLYAFHLATMAYALLKPKDYRATVPIDDAVLQALKGVEWPSYTILCPLYKEAKIAAQYVRAMAQLDYPKDKLQVLFLLEEDDKETQAALHTLALPSFAQVLLVPTGTPRTKPRACNYGLMHARGQYCVIYDAEDIPEPSQLKKAVLTFAQHGPEVACVQASLNFYNTRQSLLSRFFTIEYSVWFDVILPSLQRIGVALPLGGTSNHFQTTYLRALGGWDAYNVTEDCDLGMRLAQYGLKTAMLSSTTYEEATTKLSNWIRQRSRWIKGYMQTYLVQSRSVRSITRRKSRLKTFLSLQWIIGIGTSIFFINPLMWAMFFMYVFFRSHVEGLYHVLFPAPILYLGTLCLIFGNLFCLYVAMIACMQRERYELVKWCLLLPLYWLFISAAACKALLQLITKPHYWEKTQHGSHIKGSDDDAWKDTSKKIVALAKEDEQFHSAQTQEDMVPVTKVDPYRPVSSITEQMLAMPTVQTAAISLQQKKSSHVAKKVKVRDFWLFGVIGISFLASINSTIYYYLHHKILLYADAQAHIRLARSLFDSRTPGFAQLGQVWLPLHHLFIVPFVWDDFLWRTGLAGSIPAMIAYVVGAIYCYFLLKNLTKNPLIAFVVVMGYVFNPNLLYLQSTPLSDTFCVCAFTITSYYFLLWMQTNKIKYLIMSAVATFCSTLIRYDGWALCLFLIFLLIFISFLRGNKKEKLLSTTIVFTIISFLGIVLWLIWCKIIDGSFLFFQSGPYSSQEMQMELLHSNVLPTYHNIFKSIVTYFLDAVKNVGVGYFILIPISLIFAFYTYRKRMDGLAVLVCFVPFIFYIVTLYTGQSVIYTPGATPVGLENALFNTRYGIQALVPMLLILATPIAYILPKIRTFKMKYFIMFIVLLAVLSQSFLINKQGIVTYQEGIQQCSYTLTDIKPENIYFQEHYDNGGILTDMHASGVDPRNFNSTISQLIDESNNLIWKAALAHPEKYVHWIAYNPQNVTHDGLALALLKENNIPLMYYHLVLNGTNGLKIYLLNTVKTIPNRSLPSSWKGASAWCKP